MEKCTQCGGKIYTMAFKGTGVCGELCRKVRDRDADRPRSQVDAGITNLLSQPEGLNHRGIH
jgi:hypothetical protein